MKLLLEEYIELLNEEINKTIRHEVDNGFTDKNEYDLHVLFENRKHAAELQKEHERTVETKPVK